MRLKGLGDLRAYVEVTGEHKKGERKAKVIIQTTNC